MHAGDATDNPQTKEGVLVQQEHQYEVENDDEDEIIRQMVENAFSDEKIEALTQQHIMSLIGKLFHTITVTPSTTTTTTTSSSIDANAASRGSSPDATTIATDSAATVGKTEVRVDEESLMQLFNFYPKVLVKAFRVLEFGLIRVFKLKNELDSELSMAQGSDKQDQKPMQKSMQNQNQNQKPGPHGQQLLGKQDNNFNTNITKQQRGSGTASRVSGGNNNNNNSNNTGEKNIDNSNFISEFGYVDENGEYVPTQSFETMLQGQAQGQAQGPLSIASSDNVLDVGGEQEEISSKWEKYRNFENLVAGDTEIVFKDINYLSKDPDSDDEFISTYNSQKKYYNRRERQIKYQYNTEKHRWNLNVEKALGVAVNNVTTLRQYDEFLSKHLQHDDDNYAANSRQHRHLGDDGAAFGDGDGDGLRLRKKIKRNDIVDYELVHCDLRSWYCSCDYFQQMLFESPATQRRGHLNSQATNKMQAATLNDKHTSHTSHTSHRRKIFCGAGYSRNRNKTTNTGNDDSIVTCEHLLAMLIVSQHYPLLRGRIPIMELSKQQWFSLQMELAV